MDLKTRIEVLPCGKCEDMLDCDTCLFQKEAKELYERIRAEVLTKFAKRLLDYDTQLTKEDIIDELCFFVDRDEVDKRLQENK